jgi:hypothetical protein
MTLKKPAWIERATLQEKREEGYSTNQSYLTQE